jgi:hypothetical protein
MKTRITTIYILMLATVVMLSCSSGGGPSEAELRESVVKLLPPFLEVQDFKVEATENEGDNADPLYKSDVRAELRYTTDVYTVAERDGDVVILEMKAKQGDTAEAFGMTESTLDGNTWRISTKLKGIVLDQLGQPLDAYADQARTVIVAGTDEERAYREEKRRLEAERARLRALEPDYVTVQHILIAFAGTVPGKPVTRTQEEARQLADALLKRAQSGEDFDALVKEYTDDSYPGIYKMANAGAAADMSQKVLPRERMVTGFGDVGFSLKVGEIGMASYDPVKSKYGWHIIKRIE